MSLPPTDPSQPSPATPVTGDDPVRARRRQIARWNAIATRLGYLCFGVAIVAFMVALVADATSSMAAIVIAGLVAGSILLAPAIVIGYAIKAAERDDRERGL